MYSNTFKLNGDPPMARSDLFAPFDLGGLALPNRIVMAPMTRNRAGPGNVPTALNAEYYAQRASAGLIVTEATQVSPQGVGYPGTPGIHTDAQVEGWRRVTDAVHRAGGRIFLQLWHVGRISHPSLQPDGVLPVAPSAIAAEGEAFTPRGLQPFVVPRALEVAEIPGVVAQFEEGAWRAQAAGFDGVEIHGANGYLIDQFLRDGTNRRTDRYGGSVENRARFLLEVTEAVAGVWGADRVGVRLSPWSDFNSMRDSDPPGPSVMRRARSHASASPICTLSSPWAACPRVLRRSRPTSRRRLAGR
jgi:N-ethylmaleimide reductase